MSLIYDDDLSLTNFMYLHTPIQKLTRANLVGKKISSGHLIIEWPAQVFNISTLQNKCV